MTEEVRKRTVHKQEEDDLFGDEKAVEEKPKHTQSPSLAKAEVLGAKRQRVQA